MLETYFGHRFALLPKTGVSSIVQAASQDSVSEVVETVHKAYTVQCISSSLNFSISCMEGRYIKGCVDLCKALDIYMAVMRNNASMVWSNLFSFQENVCCPLSRQVMNILYVAKKAWNAWVVFWCMHTHLLENSRLVYLNHVTLNMVKYNLVSLIQGVEECRKDCVHNHMHMQAQRRQNWRHNGTLTKIMMMIPSEFRSLTSCMENNNDIAICNILPSNMVQTLEKFYQCVESLMEKERQQQQLLKTGSSSIIHSINPPFQDEKTFHFSLHELNLLGLICQGLGMQFWKEFVFELLYNTPKKNNTTWTAIVTDVPRLDKGKENSETELNWMDQVSIRNCDGWLDTYLACSMRLSRFSHSLSMVHGAEPLLHDIMHGFYGVSFPYFLLR